MKRIIKGAFLPLLVLINLAGYAQNLQAIPEFVFKNAVLISGLPNQDGAVYKFSNIAPGYDATVTILGRSSSSVVLDTIDMASMGWDKALQPKAGLAGIVPANSNWWIKFQLDFLQAGKSKAANIGKFQATALDVDGDGLTIQENLKMFKVSSVKMSNPTLITTSPAVTVICPKDNKTGVAVNCTVCNGLGYTLDGGGNQKVCKNCNGVGYVFSSCGHPWTGSDITITGPVKNATDIDTTSTGNMATFTYDNVSSFTFQYGGQSGAAVSDAGERLNSIWFKAFSLTAPVTLPIQLEDFAARYENDNVVLNWSTSAEVDFSHFVIERSTDGKAFSDIALVFGAGDKDLNANYTYKDSHVTSSTGTVFYRLRSVDKSTTYTYSEVRIIRLNKNLASVALNVFPNPFSDQVRLAFPDTWQGKEVMIEVYAGNGARIQMSKINNASQTESVKIASLANGFYLLKASCMNETAEQRVIKN